MQGFSLHAVVRCRAGDRQALEQLCRCITRSALANDRVHCNAAGQVVLKLKTPWCDGRSHFVMSPEFMHWLAATVLRPPRPAAKQLRDAGSSYGFAAPNSGQWMSTEGRYAELSIATPP